MITSMANSRVKHVVNLLRKAKYRRENGLFVVEGIKMVLEAPWERVDMVYVSEDFFLSHKEEQNGIEWKSPKVEVVSDAVFKQMSDTKTPQGIMAAVRMKECSMNEIVGGDKTFVIVCEDIQDPGNMGTILRTGEGAGVTGVIMSKNTVDIYNPKTIRSTMGSVYRVPFLIAEDLQDAVRQMKLLGVKVYAAHLNGNNSYAAEDYSGKCAFLIGNEGNGLKDDTAALADRLVKIPMEGSVESLNAAVSSAVLMYEVNRQRRL
ncbi:MAG: RNA methyltransferase [Alistipes sp.]|nr:RNA methyltransferase [Alistipes sp.]